VNTLDISRLIEAVRAAQQAPSVLNTQPWSFKIVVSSSLIELHADPGEDPEGHARYLKFSDRRKREMIISCGAALFNLDLAIRVIGYRTAVQMLPNGREDLDLLARVTIETDRIRQATYREQRLFEAIPWRHTTREPFRLAKPGMNMVAELKQAGWAGLVDVRLPHGAQIKRLRRDIDEVNRKLEVDKDYLSELMQWTGPSSTGGRGVPAGAFGPPVGRYWLIRDLGIAWQKLRRRSEPLEDHVQLILLTTQEDTPMAWMRAGWALQKILLTATTYHVAASFVTQLFEYHDRYHDVTYHMYPWPGYCHVVIRLGNPSGNPYPTPHEPNPRVQIR